MSLLLNNNKSVLVLLYVSLSDYKNITYFIGEKVKEIILSYLSSDKWDSK